MYFISKDDGSWRYRMKKVLFGFLGFLFVLPVFALTDLSQGRSYQELTLMLESGETLALTATAGRYVDFWQRSHVTLEKVKETQYEDLYVVDQQPLYHIMIVPSWPKKEFEDKASAVLQGPAEGSFKTIKILAPSHVKILVEQPLRLEPGALEVNLN